MLFDIKNVQKINPKEVYLHDDIFVGFRFDRAKREAIARCLNQEKGNYIVLFNDVIGIEMTSCDFWGPSLHIDNYSFVETNEHVLIPRLQKEHKRYSKLNDSPFDSQSYIETVIYFVSGDHLRVACKTVQIEHEDSL